jgi:F-type H+-transporting ATPase subunit a
LERIEHPAIIHIPGVPEMVVMSWIVAAILLILGIIGTRKVSVVPDGLQNLLEAAYELLRGTAEGVIGKEVDRYMGLIATVCAFILAGNLLGAIPGLKSPTSSLNTNAAVAVVVFLAYHYYGIRAKGLWGYIKHFAGPIPWLAPLMVPVEFISHLARPLSLSVRLFGNMFGEHIVIGVLGILAALLVPVPMMLFGVLITGPIQAFVFTFLTIVYISGAVGSEEHEGRG